MKDDIKFIKKNFLYLLVLFLSCDWANGSNKLNQSGIYATHGIDIQTNIPEARAHSISWVDSSNNLWLFGGICGIFCDLNDLWKYNPSDNTWTWVSGSKIANQDGVYGTKGVSSTTNMPGARYGLISWIDSSGNLWLFGGDNVSNSGGYLNDLWKYNPSDNTWTWISGSNTTYQTGVYGTKGVPSTTNVPGARENSTSWIDSSGNLWLFGGYFYDGSFSPNNHDGDYNDLWKYNPSDNTWTWVSGSNITNQVGVYSTKGVASATNIPGARLNPISWADSSGNLWLFGGIGYDSTGSIGDLNDLWKYNPAANTWIWVSGNNIASQPGIYGTQGVASTTNIPGGRRDAITWIDSHDNLWLFGGDASTDNGNYFNFLNDLWKYNPANNTWTWVSGSDKVNQSGVYGIKGVPSKTNIPGARLGAVSWIDSSGNLWLFGGDGNNSTDDRFILNDLWEYSPTNNTWTWVGGSMPLLN